MYTYNRRLDRMVGHSGWGGAHGHGFHDWMIDEIELGARVALAIDDPDRDQWWWNLQFTFNRQQLIADGVLEPEPHDKELV